MPSPDEIRLRKILAIVKNNGMRVTMDQLARRLDDRASILQLRSELKWLNEQGFIRYNTRDNAVQYVCGL